MSSIRSSLKITDFVDSDCSICTNSFDGSTHTPMILCPNQHTYCKKCVPSLLKNNKRCPECRQPTVTQPKPNRILLDVIQFKKQLFVQNRQNGKNCTEHSADQTTEDKSEKGINHHDQDINTKNLSLRRKNLQSINRLSKYNALQFLNLSQNFIMKIEKLPKAKNLKQLYFKNNLIQKIEGLQFFEHLQKLSLANNKVEKIQGFSGLKNLKYLFLQNNQIKKIENLECLSKLQTLNLSFNKIKVIENLSKLKSLACLNLEANIIQVFQGFQKNHLKVLVLDHNEITHVPKLPNSLQKLEILSLCINKLQQVSDCPGIFNFNFFKQQYEVQLESAQQIFLKGNAVCKKLEQVSKIWHHTRALLKPSIII